MVFSGATFHNLMRVFQAAIDADHFTSKYKSRVFQKIRWKKPSWQSAVAYALAPAGLETGACGPRAAASRGGAEAGEGRAQRAAGADEAVGARLPRSWGNPGAARPRVITRTAVPPCQWPDDTGVPPASKPHNVAVRTHLQLRPAARAGNVAGPNPALGGGRSLSPTWITEIRLSLANCEGGCMSLTHRFPEWTLTVGAGGPLSIAPGTRWWPRGGRGFCRSRGRRMRRWTSAAEPACAVGRSAAAPLVGPARRWAGSPAKFRALCPPRCSGVDGVPQTRKHRAWKPSGIGSSKSHHLHPAPQCSFRLLSWTWFFGWEIWGAGVREGRESPKTINGMYCKIFYLQLSMKRKTPLKCNQNE